MGGRDDGCEQLRERTRGMILRLCISPEIFTRPITSFGFVFFVGAVVTGVKVFPALFVVVLSEVRHGGVAKVNHLDIAFVGLHEHRFFLTRWSDPRDLARGVQRDFLAFPGSLRHGLKVTWLLTKGKVIQVFCCFRGLQS